ncbi:MAG: serine/threonine protein kinase [Bifidobacteriaceae bacterium]|jgi:serine/threonine protein kinase|nr:serine/threonine protein kinase [Bifidobacteriaceae bacterium]
MTDLRDAKVKLNDLVGQTIGDGKYRLGQVLGAGNFGTVFRAVQQLDEHRVRDVALKVFSPEASSRGNVEGMLADCALPAKVLASSAPITIKRHFAQIYDFGYIDTPVGRCAFVAMELIRGAQTLEDVSKRYHNDDRFPRAEMVRDYMRQFFTALAAAHGAEVLHRDIKGANVMVDAGVLRIMDFGMGAYLSQPDAALKTTMSIYAPENFEGRYTAASDVYQAGLMFYQFYTGIEPFAPRGGQLGGQTDMLEERRRRTDFRYRLGKDIPGVHYSEALDAILARCLAYTEMTRFGSARAVLDALEEADPSATLDQALASGEWGLADQLAGQVLDNPESGDEERVAALAARARAAAATDQDAQALENYRQAVGMAEASGALFHRPSEFNALVDAVVLIYTKRGQGGMARLFAKKRK